MIGVIVGISIATILFIVVCCMFAWYRVVPQSQAHNVVVPNGEDFVASPDKNVSTNGKKSYFAIPEFIPFFGRVVRIMDITVKEIVGGMETYEKGQARYNVTYSLKYRIKDVVTAAQKFDTDNTLKSQLVEVIQSAVRAVTVKYDVTDARAKKSLMSDEIEGEMHKDLSQWGLELVNFQLVDFQDTNDSSIISDISKRREVEIHARTREENASKLKDARFKEAECDESAQKREILRDEEVLKAEQNKKQKIAEQEKLAKEKEFEVIRVQQIKQAEIDKDKAKVEAEMKREVQLIEKERNKLEGEGIRLRLEEEAKGNAAGIREKGLAEAYAKDKLQEALNKFTDSAIRALTAEILVQKDKEVGIATAKALETADLRVLSGGDTSGFDLGKLIESVSVVDESSSTSLKNRIARPSDVGFNVLGLESTKKKKEKLIKPVN